MTGKTALETGCGSLSYSAPELVGCKPYGKEVDIWSMSAARNELPHRHSCAGACVCMSS